jgi:putative Holliday junction resolvase
MALFETEIEEFKTALARNERLIGLDLGTKTIGVALSDVMRSVATPLIVLKKAKLKVDVAALQEIIGEHGVGGIVLGLPKNMDNTEGPRAQSTRAFARNIDAALGLPILFWDERLSTAAVTRTLIEADTSRKKRAEVIDKMAAAYILQGALDRLARV